jgi:tRNA dimethylallyltransferase
MFAGGWVEEVQSLLNKGYVVDDPGMKSHGYREIAESLLSNDDPTLLIESIAAKTRQYARRQETWWRNDSRIHWIQCHGHLGRDA